MTSNVGSDYIKQMSNLGFSTSDEEEFVSKENDFKQKVQGALKERFRPEFLNRIDDIIVFNPLTQKDIEKIVDVQLEQIKERLAAKGFQIEIGSGLKEHIVKNGFDPEYGARPIRRVIQKMILDKMADKMITGNIKNAGKVKINLTGTTVSVSS